MNARRSNVVHLHRVVELPLVTLDDIVRRDGDMRPVTGDVLRTRAATPSGPSLLRVSGIAGIAIDDVLRRLFRPSTGEGAVKIALYIESDTEKGILGKLHDGSRSLSIKQGSFYHTRGGWQRYQPFSENYGYGIRSTEGDESTMIVLRAASCDRSGEAGETSTKIEGSTEGESAVTSDSSADAQKDRS